MAPSLSGGARVLACTLARIRPGDVVICLSPRSDGPTVKRVVSVEGNQILVEGDNLLHSTDSRHFGPIARDRILARVWCQVAPRWKIYV